MGIASWAGGDGSDSALIVRGQANLLGDVTALADLVRAMNCYYSNLIEGHDTHPIDIERAMKNDYSQDAPKRDL